MSIVLFACSSIEDSAVVHVTVEILLSLKFDGGKGSSEVKGDGCLGGLGS